MAAPTITPSRAARHAKPESQEPPPRSRLRQILRWTLWLAIPVLAIFAGTVIGLVYAFARVPLPDEVPTAQTIVFLDQSGRTEIGTLTSQENRRVVKLDKIPLHVRQAVLAAEDRDFYEHGAISWRGLARATAANLLRRRISEGGSTITQQYVKNAFPGVGRDRTLFRKLKEAVIAVKLERKHKKDEILEFYLNTVYFGRGAYGIDAAARTYFSRRARAGKPGRKVTVEKLTPAQAALLAGVIRSPEFYGTQERQVSAKARRDFILQVMLDRGWLSPKQARTALNSRLGIDWGQKRGGIVNSRAPYFLEKVRQYLVDKYGAEAVNMGGFRVRTTLDLRMQGQAVAAVRGVLDEGKSEPRAALVAVDPGSGAVRAMYGGGDYAKRQLNYATDTRRQAGSTMKPFVLAQALSDGYSVESAFEGPSKLIVDGEPFANYDDVNYGWMDLTEATRLSVNTVYVQLMRQVQPKRVVELSKKHGLTAELHLGTPVKPGKSPLEKSPILPSFLSLGLGAGDVTTLQLASSFGTWANRGWHHAPHLVEKVVDSNGRVIEQHDYDTKGVQVVHANVADTVNQVLRQAVEDGTGTEARLPDRQVAGKTGTTSDYVDARFVGYTPGLVASVWLGYDNEKEKRSLLNIHGLRAVSGGTLPARIFHNFMVEATAGTEAQSFVEPEPSGVPLNSTTLPPTTTPPTTQPPQQPQPTNPGFPTPSTLPGQPGPSLPPQPGPGPGSTVRQ
ncbi:MAG TPA: transglycosylase domain-containing protein [Actinomycetes bacterium]|nr:transglycosylase domain-containing protein [Actinomycetes bacterium]